MASPRVNRHEAEERASLSEERFRLLVEGVRDYAIFMLDPQGIVTSWNPGAQRIKGYTPDEILGKHFSTFYTPEDLQRGVPQRALRTATGEGRFEAEGWRMRKDGTRFWANVVITPLYDEGQLRGFAKVTRDLTERRRSEEELRQSEELFRQMFDHAPIGISMVGLDYKFLRVNAAFCDMLGYTQEELAGRTFVDITYPDDLEADLSLADKLFKGEIPTYRLEKRYITKSGDVIWIELTVTIVRDTTGEPLYVLGMVENISERKQDEETIKRLNEDLERRVVERTAQLQSANIELEREIEEREAVTQENVRLLAQVEQQRQRLDNIIANVPGVVWEAWGVPDAVGQRIDFVSNYVETLLGYTQEDWLDTPNFWLTIVHPDDKEAAANVARQTFESGRAGTNQFRWVAKDGRVVWVESHSAPMLDAHGTPLGMRGVTMDITERKRLEEQVLDQAEILRREYERLANLVANVKVGLALSDKENRYVLVNDAWLETAGYTREQVIGRRVEEFEHGPNRESYQALADRILAEGEPVHMPESFLQNEANPQGRYVDASIVPMRDDEGNVTGLLTAVIDVTEKVHTRQAIEDQRKFLELIIESTPVAIAFYDREMRVVDVNSTWLELTGLREQDVKGQVLYDVNPQAPARKELYDRALAGETYKGEGIPNISPDGELRYVDAAIRPVHDSEGKILGILVTSVDVTEKIRSKDEIEAQRSLLATIIEGMPVGVVYYDTDMRIVNYNAEWERIAGVRYTGDLRGLTLYEIDPQTEERKHLHMRALEGEMISLVDVPHVQPRTGKTVYGDIHLRPVQDANSKIVGLLSAIVDSTLRHELDQAKDSFIALASHELKTPITTIKGYAQSTLRNLDSYDGVKLARTLSIINDQANRITRLVNEMLDVSRMESQTLTFDVEHFDLRSIIEEVASNQTLVSPEFELELHLPEEPLIVGADRQRLEQVLTNLVQNAIKYSGDSRRIEVVAMSEGGEAIVSVRDYGVGIPVTQQSRVFQRFFRASNVSTSNYSGLGLGLFISHGIISRHGGRMWLESAEGEGSTFYFALPLAGEQ
jgi:PAS domain S-box-containing protein